MIIDESNSVADAVNKLQLYGFNNLTKTLSFNIYDICYAKTAEHQREYIEYIDEAYNAARLTDILTDVTRIIGAKVLNIAHRDYEPQGASVTLLVSELEAQHYAPVPSTEAPGPLPEAVAAHLDKSHITVHTYPESHPDDGIATFRADIDVSTCGVISPLKALNFLIHSFDSDIVTVDYRVRGFTRGLTGEKYFIDHPINSIQNYLAGPTKNRYEIIDVNVYQENIFHTKMCLKDFKIDDYLFGLGEEAYTPAELTDISARLRHEMFEIFYGRNMPKLQRPNDAE